MTLYIVKTERQRGIRCPFAHYKIAVLEMDDSIAVRAARISTDALGVMRIVHFWSHQKDQAGKSSGYALTLARAEVLAEALNIVKSAPGGCSLDREDALKLAIIARSREELRYLRLVQITDHGLRYGQKRQRRNLCSLIGRTPQCNGTRATQIWAEWSPPPANDKNVIHPSLEG